MAYGILRPEIPASNEVYDIIFRGQVGVWRMELGHGLKAELEKKGIAGFYNFDDSWLDYTSKARH